MVTDLMPITGTIDNDIAPIIEIIVKDQLGKDMIIIVMLKIIIEVTTIAGIQKTADIQMTTDMQEIIKSLITIESLIIAEGLTKTTVKMVMENVNSYYQRS
jgi:hypothetical protein